VTGTGPRSGSAGPVQFWFDFASTYSCVAALRVEAAAAAAGVAIEWRPFLLGPIFERQGWNDSPYNLNPARGRYMWHDVARSCRMLGFPFRKPSRFPRNPVPAARVACTVRDRPWFPEFARAVFRANFAEDRDIADAAVLTEILAGVGQDGGSLLDQARSPERKGLLRAATESAWSLGIFGAPSFIVGEELFWGNDRLEQALSWARGATA
jgi:2-hydroxychromene-2-carboxylate isomerase